MYFNVQEVQRGSGYDDEIWVRCDEDEMEVDDDEEEEEEEEEDLSLASLVNLDHLRAAKLKEQRQNFDWTTDDWPEGNWSWPSLTSMFKLGVSKTRRAAWWSYKRLFTTTKAQM